MTRRYLVGLGLLALAYALLIPGVFQPMLTLTGDIDKARLAGLGKQLIAESPTMVPMLANMLGGLVDQLALSGSIQAYEKTRSIAGTVGDLFNTGNVAVGFLVLLFSVIVPLLKGVMLVLAQFPVMCARMPWLQQVSGALSKWSMADVFVIAIIVAYMAANASADSAEIFTLRAEFRSGFYCFLGYCLLSILSSQLLNQKSAKLQIS